MRIQLGAALALAVAFSTPVRADESKPSVADLVRVLEDADTSSQTKQAALAALAKHGRKAAPAVPALKMILLTPPGKVDLRPSAVTTLGAIGKPAVPALIEGLKLKDGLIRRSVLKSIGEIGLNAREAIPTLLGWIDAELAKQDGAVDFEWLTVLGELSPDAKDFVPRAIKIIQVVPDFTPNRKVRGDRLQSAELAVTMLADYGPAAKDAVPVLVRVLKMPDGGQRYYMQFYLLTMSALGEIGPDAVDALPALRILLDSPGELGKSAERAIARIKAPRPKEPGKRIVWKSVEVTVKHVKADEWIFTDLTSTFQLRERRSRAEYIELVVVDGPDDGEVVRLGDTIRLYADRMDRRLKGETAWKKADEGAWTDK